MVETLAIIMSALPVAGIFATWIPFSAIATLITGLHEIAVEPEHLTRLFDSLITDPELQPDVLIGGLFEEAPELLIEAFKETFQIILGM